MKTNEKKSKNSIVRIIVLLILTVTVIALVGFAYARYITRINGQAQASIANLFFTVTAGSSQSLNIDLADTRLANDTNKTTTKNLYWQ